MKNLFVRFVREEEGQDLIEYSLLAAVIAVGSMAVLPGVSTAINGVFTKVTGALNNPTAATP
jgi:pilus assembly protein Flp/PilA